MKIRITPEGIPCGENPETCAVEALRGWLKEAGIETGPVFRAVNRHGKFAPRGLYRDSIVPGSKPARWPATACARGT